ncbi:MAG: hypothetical protein K2H14_09070 [Muribaculaceae bacterium]|nr:hypothetical protein [Muribaculaceae bacterium]
MEKENRNNGKQAGGRVRDTWLLRTLHGRILSIDFFKRNWVVVLGVAVMLMIYITSRYECQTKMERIRALETELEVAKTERVRAKSAYMSRIRESSMQQMVDSLRLGLTVQEQPPYRLSRKPE